MESINPQGPGTFTFAKIVDTIIRLALLFFLLGWCIIILKPFALILIWAAVIAIALYPLYIIFLKVFRKRKAWASVVLTLLMLSILVIPSWLLTQSVFEEVSHLRDLNKQGQLVIPPPGKNTETWPSIAKPVVEFWRLASVDLQEAMATFRPNKGCSCVGSFSCGWHWSGVLQFVVSIIIAGVLLAYSTSVANAATKIFIKLVGKNGKNFASTTVATIRSVVKGILGVAVIQATMAGLGFFIAGVPYAGLWTVLCLFFAIIQVGAGPVAIPIIIHML